MARAQSTGRQKKLGELYGAIAVKKRWPGKDRVRAIVGRKLGEQVKAPSNSGR